MAVAACLMLAACEAPAVLDADAMEQVQDEAQKTKKFTFTMKGDFSDEWKPVTRGYLAADGKDLTDVWVLDYMGDNLVQQLHQSDNTAADFGKPVMQLAYGSHHIYFIATRGTEPTLTTDAATLTWAKPSDTFWKDYSVDVVSTSNGNRAVTLDRVVTKLKLAFTDEVPEGCTQLAVTPATWYYGLNYRTGQPCAPQTATERTVAVPASYVGTSDQLMMTIYGLSTAAEWQTALTIEARADGGGVLGSATIPDAPFKANRVTEYSGPIFGTTGPLALSLSAEWESSYEGTW